MSDERRGQPPPGQPPPSQPPPGWGPPPPPPYGYGPPPQPPPYGYGPPPQPAPPYGYGRPLPQTDGTAITALVLAIASFAVVPTFILAPVGPILAIVALALCPSARRRIETSGGAVTGAGLVTAARIIGWINIGLTAFVALILIIVAIAGGFSDNDEFSLVLSLLR